MTVGTRTLDGRYAVSTSCGAGMAGNYFTKTWNGADYPPSKPTYAKTYEPYTSTEWKKVKVWYGRFYIWEMRQITVERQRVRTTYVKPVKRSRVVEHAYSVTWQDYSDPLYSWFNSVAWKTGTLLTCQGGPSIGASTWNSNDDIALLNKLREKVVGSSFNPSVFLAEGHKAISMIFESATRIGKAWRFARKGNFIAAERALLNGTGRQNNAKDGAGNWLQLQYGWRPLLEDAKTGAEYLAHQTSAPLQHVVRVSKRKEEPPLFFGNSLVKFNERYGYTRKSIKAIIRSLDTVSLSGLTDPRAAIWEVIPYSFVLDWFIPIQDYLEALNVANSVQGTFVISTKYVKGFRGCYNSNPSEFFSNPSSRWEVGSFSRGINTSLSSLVSFPQRKSLGKALTAMHSANAVALLLALPRDIPDTPANPNFKPLRLGNGTIKGGHWKLASRGI